MRVSIVDDALDRQAARRRLTSTGMVQEIAEAERGAEALELLSAGGFDAALLNFQLPDGGGLEILRKASARRITTPLIMLTGYSDDLVATALMKAGASDYLSKARLTPDLPAQSLRHLQRVGAARADTEREQLLLHWAAEQGRIEAILTSMTDGLIVEGQGGTLLTMPDALPPRRVPRRAGRLASAPPDLPIRAGLAIQSLT